jgi:uncharacterized protein YcaQ
MPDTNPLISVDAGDLDEACQSANAWAGYLRKKNAVPINYHSPEVIEIHRQNCEAADRIDAAVHRLREATYKELSRNA